MSRGELEAVIAGSARWTVIQGDSADSAKLLPDNSIDAIVSDPPAGISFMGKAWDGDKGGEEHWIAWLTGILRDGYRALKPGGHVLLWALPRTSDWTMQALRRAGFEVRDVIVHHFGSGFPKSLDVSKAIDAAAGAVREVVGERKLTGTARIKGGQGGATSGRAAELYATHEIRDTLPLTAPATPAARTWQGFGTALKPASEFWILARKPLDGTVAANVLRHGTGALNIDAARVDADPGLLAFRAALGLDDKTGRFPANLVLSHAAWEETVCACGAVLSFVARFCPECGSGDVEHVRCGCRAVGARRVKGAAWDGEVGTRPGGFGDVGAERGSKKPNGRTHADPDGLETVTAWECLATCSCGLSRLAPEGGAPPRCRCGRAMAWTCPVARLDEQSGELRSGSDDITSSMSGMGYGGGNGSSRSLDGSEGGASRFFNTFAPPDNAEPFFYCAKPSAAETEAGCERLPAKSAAQNVDREEGSAGMKSPRAGAGRTSGR